MFSAPPAPRRVLRPPLRVELASDRDRPRFLGYAADLSVSGAFLQNMRPKPPGTLLEMRLHLGNPISDSIECVAEVIWTRGYSGRHGPSPGMGIKFLDLDASALETLARLFPEAS